MRLTPSGFNSNSAIHKNIRSKVMALTLMSAAVATSSCSREQPKEYLPADSTVVALGDSLTYGYGATPQTSYPAILAELTGWQIINAGVNGDTSADVLARSAAIIAQNPDLVLLGVGGNDVLSRTEPLTTKANISATIATIKAANIPVVLIAEPHFSSVLYLAEPVIILFIKRLLLVRRYRYIAKVGLKYYPMTASNRIKSMPMPPAIVILHKGYMPFCKMKAWHDN